MQQAKETTERTNLFQTLLHHLMTGKVRVPPATVPDRKGGAPMLIHNLELRNFLCFDHYSLSLAVRFTVLIGDNGSGKSAVLDALAVAVAT